VNARTLPYWLVASGLILGVILVTLVSIPTGRKLTVTINDTPQTFSLERSILPFSDGCVNANWAVEGIQAISVNSRATVGVANEEVCLGDRTAVVWDVTFSDGTRRTYSLPIIVLARNPLGLLVAGFGLVLTTIGATWLVWRHVPPMLGNLQQRGALRTVGVMLFSTLVTLLMLEGGFRLWLFAAGTEQQKALYLYDIDRIEAMSTIYMGLPYFNYGMNPQHEDVNTMGYRGDLVPLEKPEDTYRIVTLGGSTTFGWHVDTADTWPQQLETVLRFDLGYENVEVVNLASLAYNSHGSVTNLFIRGVNFDPDLVIVYHGINDAFYRMANAPDCFNGPNPLFGMGGDVGIWQYSRTDLPPSTLYRWVALNQGWMTNPTGLIDRLRPTDLCDPAGLLSYDQQVRVNTAELFENNMRSLVGIATAHDSDILLSSFTWNTDDDISEFGKSSPEITEPAAFAIAEQNAALERIASETNAFFYDFAADMPPGDLYWDEDGFHQTAEGNRKQAELFAAYLHEQEIIR
jgi:lysophospholipase L1-like esterase